jgi:hypothetical protein
MNGMIRTQKAVNRNLALDAVERTLTTGSTQEFPKEGKMKKTMLVLTTVVCLALGSVYLTASTSSRLRVDVPFAFSVGRVSLPAGQYIVEFERLNSGGALGSCLVIKSETGKVYQRVTSLPSSEGALREGAQLIFNKYASHYFLARVESYGLACDLQKTSAERELAARMNHKSQPVPVAAD